MKFSSIIPVTIPEKIKYARLQASLIINELTAALGIDRATLMRYEQGEITEELMNVDTLTAVAVICKMDKHFCCSPYHIFIDSNAGQQIKSFRKNNKLTQKDFAERFHVSITTVKRWERSKNRPPVVVWRIICKNEI